MLSDVTSRSNWAKDNKTFSVSRPMEVVVLKAWVTETNDTLGAARFYQRRGFVLSALRPGAVDEARRRLKPEIGTVGDFGIPLRDELELERSARRAPAIGRAS